MKATDKDKGSIPTRLTRRELLEAGAVSATAIVAGIKTRAAAAPAVHTGKKPNILYIITDQQGLDTISANGCRDISTPALDQLARRGLSFDESYCSDPVCSPSRSSLFTGRMPSETGVIHNSLPIRPTIPNLGQWFGQQGYECVYTGKWHLATPFASEIPGFKTIPTGMSGRGMVGDSAISRACQGYLGNRTGSEPFLLVASFLQPHDICQWVSMHRKAPDVLPYPEIADKLPELPANFNYDPREPAHIKKRRQAGRGTTQQRHSWSEQQWRYYVWSYYRHVEMVDAEIGRVLDALQESGYADNTLIVFTADHGEGRGRHQLVLKNYLYDEAAKVPLILWPGQIPQGEARSHAPGLGLGHRADDVCICRVSNTFKCCGTQPQTTAGGKKLRLAEFLAAEVQIKGRMIRTPDYKYITYKGDPVEQLFDMKADPGETKNLADESKYASVLANHKKLLQGWEVGWT